MKKIAIGIATVAALIAAPALAADMPVKMPVKAPPPPPAPVYSWTGFYVGGNVGYSWGGANTDLRGSGSVTTFPSIGSATIPFTSPFDFADSGTTRPNGVIGGVQIGYNYQFSPNGVVGLEADIQGSGERGGVQQFANIFSGTLVGNEADLFPFNGAATSNVQAKIDWFGTVRGRLGFLVGDQLLIYGTGGLAYGEVALSGTSNLNFVAAGCPGPCVLTPATAALDGSKTNAGFVVGAGMEGRIWLSSNWTWKVEYLYLDLGSRDTSTSFAMFPPPGTILSPATGTVTTHTHFTDNIVRVGLNYQFH